MAEPAYGGAEGARPEHPAAAQLDPRKLIWADVRRAMVTQAEACARSVAGLAARPDDDAALEMARLCLGVLESLGEMARQWTIDEAVFDEQYAAGYREGYEACRADRCRLGVIDGGRATPGPH